ncbi:hypothetical protein KCTC52924_00014 [Arenibacter antarcticus]|uniref:DUF4249 family protein n=1 Tax=Arenibacter antarcticus TaxID=2040469 RepID=A0ABW5VF09_9FLAO|nr:DUF4249 family protein [Arenibacter sp. H213]MCM4169785.1 hypothetical protein [Arenibacter sp. H213]
MRKLLFFILLFAIIGCQDVIDVELPTEDPRLVIDAVIRINDIFQPKTLVSVKARLSSSFFDSVQPAQLQGISISNTDNNTSINLEETEPGSGVYQTEWETEQLIEGNLELTLQHLDQTYRANTKFVPGVPIDSLKQGTSTLFREDETEVLVSFTDNGTRNDFYLFDFAFGEYLVTEDEFYQGQRFEFSFFYDKDLKNQKEVKISLLGVDKIFFNYMNQLIQLSGPVTGPFSTPAITVRGNIINITSPVNLNNAKVNNDNFALGYFAVCQTFSSTITINK